MAHSETSFRFFRERHCTQDDQLRPPHQGRLICTNVRIASCTPRSTPDQDSPAFPDVPVLQA